MSAPVEPLTLERLVRQLAIAETALATWCDRHLAGLQELAQDQAQVIAALERDRIRGAAARAEIERGRRLVAGVALLEHLLEEQHQARARILEAAALPSARHRT